MEHWSPVHKMIAAKIENIEKYSTYRKYTNSIEKYRKMYYI